jgi:hypothetical protein
LREGCRKCPLNRLCCRRFCLGPPRRTTRTASTHPPRPFLAPTRRAPTDANLKRSRSAAKDPERVRRRLRHGLHPIFWLGVGCRLHQVVQLLQALAQEAVCCFGLVLGRRCGAGRALSTLRQLSRRRAKAPADAIGARHQRCHPQSTDVFRLQRRFAQAHKDPTEAFH